MTPLEMHRLAVEYYEAIERGEPFQVQSRYPGNEWSYTDNPLWSSSVEYRRKPEPRVIYLVEFANGKLSEMPDGTYEIYGEPLQLIEGCRLVKFVEVIE